MLSTDQFFVHEKVWELADKLREIPCPRCHPDTASELEQITTLQALAKNPARLQEMAVLCDAAMDKGDLGPLETWHNPDDTRRIEVLEQHNKKLIGDLLHFETQLALAQHHLLRNGIGLNGEDLNPDDDGEEDDEDDTDLLSALMEMVEDDEDDTNLLSALMEELGEEEV